MILNKLAQNSLPAALERPFQSAFELYDFEQTQALSPQQRLIRGMELSRNAQLLSPERLAA